MVCHNVIQLITESYGPNVFGYTRNHPQRGGQLSPPCFDENGEIVVIEITFHKGDPQVESSRARTSPHRSTPLPDDSDVWGSDGPRAVISQSSGSAV